MHQSTALIALSSDPRLAATQSTQLKRLALVFDRIEFIPPEIWAIEQQDLDKIAENGRVLTGQAGPVGIDPFLHPIGAITVPVDALAPPLKDTLEALIDAGIAIGSDASQTSGNEILTPYKKIKHDLAWAEAKDEVFSGVTGTILEGFQVDPVKVTMEIYGTMESPMNARGEYEVTGTMDLYALNVPESMIDSAMISDTLHSASERGCYPVFLSRNHRQEIRRRYELYQEGMTILRNAGAESLMPLAVESMFGEVSFRIVSDVFRGEVIDSKTVGEIVRYRSSMEEARRRFVSEILWESTKMVEGNPWGIETKNSIKRYIETDLANAILEYDRLARSTWVKLFGSALVASTELGRNAIYGGLIGAVPTVPAIIADLLPHQSGIGLIAIACIGGVARKSPSAVRHAIDLYEEARSRERTGIAYVSNFS